jgi:hypothetical protein
MNKGKDLRRHARIPANLEVQVSHPRFGTATLKTKDLSDGGVYVWVSSHPDLKVGDTVTVQLAHPLGDGEEPPLLHMRVVRQDDNGVGMMFIVD